MELERRAWTIKFTWIKAHAGNRGNEIADNIAKEATKTKEIMYNKISKSQIVQQVKQQSIERWQTQWEQTTKGSTTKQFFLNIKERFKQKRLKLTPNFTAIVTAHGKPKAYLHRFKIIDSPECPCETGNQTVDHLICECQRLQKEREALIRNIAKQDTWPREKGELVNKYIEQFTQFINSIDFDKIWTRA